MQYRAFSRDDIAALLESKNNKFSLPWEILSIFMQNCFITCHARHRGWGRGGSNDQRALMLMHAFVFTVRACDLFSLQRICLQSLQKRNQNKAHANRKHLGNVLHRFFFWDCKKEKKNCKALIYTIFLFRDILKTWPDPSDNSESNSIVVRWPFNQSITMRT